MKVWLNKRWWQLLFKPRVYLKGKDCIGVCRPRRRRIEIATEDVDERATIEALIHELLHGSDISKQEWWIEETAKNIATVLWRLGYRRPRE